jgi:hypothetical protein
LPTASLPLFDDQLNSPKIGLHLKKVVETEVGYAEEQPIRDIPSGDEVIRFINSDFSEFFIE